MYYSLSITFIEKCLLLLYFVAAARHDGASERQTFRFIPSFFEVSSSINPAHSRTESWFNFNVASWLREGDLGKQSHGFLGRHRLLVVVVVVVVVIAARGPRNILTAFDEIVTDPYWTNSSSRTFQGSTRTALFKNTRWYPGR